MPRIVGLISHQPSDGCWRLVDRMKDHTEGRLNDVDEINAVLTREAIDRLLLRSPTATASNSLAGGTALRQDNIP